jgi:hypothetical protein
VGKEHSRLQLAALCTTWSFLCFIFVWVHVQACVLTNWTVCLLSSKLYKVTYQGWKGLCCCCCMCR